MNNISANTVGHRCAAPAQTGRAVSALLLTAILAMALAGPAAATERKESIIHEFAEASGSHPVSGPVLDSTTGALYGSTSAGGKHGAGVIYQVLPPDATHKNWQYSVLYNYGKDIRHGYVNFPSRDATVSAGVVYATTSNGGKGCTTSGGCGVVLMLTPPTSGSGAWTATTLYRFQGKSDGMEPAGAVAVQGCSTLVV